MALNLPKLNESKLNVYLLLNINMEPTQNSKSSNKNFEPCDGLSPLSESLNKDPIPKKCADDGKPSQKRVKGIFESWQDKDDIRRKTGIGHSKLCDPMQTGQIINTPGQDEKTIYRYSKATRGCDEAMRDLFSNVIVIDEMGKSHKVPIMIAPQEKAVAAMLQENVRKDNSLVVDRLQVPLMAIHNTDFSINQERYIYHAAIDHMQYLRKDRKPAFTIQEKYHPRDTVFGITRGIPVDISYSLTVWTLYIEDMNQILEQVMTKFSPIAYIQIRGVHWEVCVKLNSIANNMEKEPGDQSLRVLKFEFNMTAESYIPQPIKKNKSVLKMKTEYTDSTNENDLAQSIERLEEAIKELE